jgi:hypothetical protein
MPALDATIPAVLQGLVIVLAVVVLVRSILRSRSSVHKGLGPSRLTSAIFAGAALVAIAIPGAELLARVRTSTLTLLGYGGLSTVHDVTAAYALTLLGLVSCVIGEELAAGRRPAIKPVRAEWMGLESKFTFWILLGFGVAGLVLLPRGSDQDTFASRGQIAGQGVFITLQYCLPLAVSVAVLASHWRSKLLPLVTLGASVLIVYWTGARTPLLMIGAAVMVRMLFQFAATSHPMRYVAACALAVYCGAVLFVGISSWRGLVIEGQTPSIVHEIYVASLDPFGQLTNGGLDTLDGLTLAIGIDPATVGASWTDPFKAITNLVPSQIWPSKPEWLGAIVTHFYLSFGGRAGIFLSGPGYLYLIFGGALGMAAAFFAIGLAFEVLLSRLRRPTILIALAAYFLFRFFVGGDAFDIFNTITLLLALLAAGGLASLLTNATTLPKHSQNVATTRQHGASLP